MLKDEIIEIANKYNPDDRFDPEDLANDLEELINSQRCKWTIIKTQHENVIKTSCDETVTHPYFLLRLDKYPFCPCCSKRIEVKDEQ